MMRKLLVYVLLVSMLLGTIGCSNTNVDPAGADVEPGEISENEPGEVLEEMPSVALVLNGPINDMDWCTDGYEGLKLIEEKYGAKISYAESVSQSDMEEVIRGYSEAGFDLIFGHSDQFRDPILAVSVDYPETQFVCVGGTETRDNVIVINTSEYESGFLIGAIAALSSENDTVGGIAGVAIQSVQESMDGFVAGAKYVNPDAEVLTAFTGSWTDAGAAKEISNAMVDNGADVLANLLGFAGMAILEAAEEREIIAIGASREQHTVAPDNVPASVIKDIPNMYTFVYEKILDDSLEQTVYKLGIAEGAVYPFYPGEVSQELKDNITTIMEDFSSGKIQM
jgi:basic membrane protein A